MTIASYTTDLTLLEDFEGTPNTAVEPASLYAAGRSPLNDDVDYPIQGTKHGSLTFNTVGLGGWMVQGTGTYTAWSSGDYMFGWITWTAPSTMNTYALGGMVMLLGSSASVFNVYYVGGSDRAPNPYGGWQNVAVDPEMTPDNNAGSPTEYDFVGMGVDCISKVNKGNPLGCDSWRYGRGEIQVVGGTSTDDDANFAGMAAANDNSSNMWGLFQEIPGGYKWKGLMSIGFGGVCNFTDSDVNIVIENSEWVASDFNRIELNNASSVVNWVNISIQSLCTVSPGQLEMMDNHVYNDTGGVYTDMDTFIYDSNTTIVGRTWRRCNQVSQIGATLTGCVFDSSIAAVALLVDDLSLLTGVEFKSSGTGHAVNLGTISASDTLPWNNTESGYAAQGGTAANRTILVNVAVDQTLTINVGVGASTPTYYNTGSGTVSVVAGQVDTVITVKRLDTLAVIVGARVELKAIAGGPLSVDTQIIAADTNGSGIASDTRSLASDQPVEGRVRKSSASPFFKTYKLTGIIDSDNGLTITALMVLDE